MFAKIPSGTSVIIQGLTCWIPPLGMGTHCDTGELQPVDIIKRSKSNEKDQYWEVQQLPSNFEDRVDAEDKRIETDPNYSDKDLDAIREREWHRRLYGVWVYINGKPVYITGLYYFFLNFWNLDTGLPDFRLIDLEYFYFWQYCVEDPRCYGMIETRKRRDGKTKRAGCIMYEFPSRRKGTWSGIQSMNRDVAADLYLDDIITPFKMLPEFFVPVYDKSQSDTPKTSLRFYRTAIKGKKAGKDRKSEELKSKIDYKDAKPKAYDGKKLHRLLLDESGKIDTDVIKRHTILKPCLVDNKRKIVGKMIVTSTVEEMGLEFRYKELWEQSDQYEREPDGTSTSGLYRFFMGANRAGSYDKYGNPYEQEELKSILNERSKVKSVDDLIDLIRKFPLTENEAFKTADKNCLYNWALLNEQLDRLSYGNNFTFRGDLVWKDGIKDTEVIWVQNKNGRFECTILPEESQRNKITKRGNLFYPANKLNYVAGGDPYDYDQTVDTRRSNGTGFIKWKFNSMHVSSIYNASLTMMYSFRPQTAAIYYEEMIKMCFFCGCEFLAERNKIGLIRHFEQRGYGAFLIKFPGEREPGIYAGKETKQEMVQVTEEFIINNVHKVFFKSLLEQWLKFDINKTEKFDEAMGAGWTLVADKNIITREEIATTTKITDLLPKNKIVIPQY